MQPAAFLLPGASLTFAGPGNFVVAPAVSRSQGVRCAQRLAAALRACRKKAKGKQRASCERQARKRYAPLNQKPKARKAAKAGRGR